MSFSLKKFATSSTTNAQTTDASESKNPFASKVINRPKLTEAQKQEMIEKRQSNIAPFRLTALKPTKGKEELRKQFTISSKQFDELNLKENEIALLAGLPLLVVVTKGNGDYFQLSKKSKDGNKSRTVVIHALVDILEQLGGDYKKPSEMVVNEDHYFNLVKLAEAEKEELLASFPDAVKEVVVEFYGIEPKTLSEEEQKEIADIKSSVEETNTIDFEKETVAEFDSIGSVEEEIANVNPESLDEAAKNILGLSSPADDLLDADNQEI